MPRSPDPGPGRPGCPGGLAELAAIAGRASKEITHTLGDSGTSLYICLLYTSDAADE